jgi:aromatic ring-opening dioxygenase catalytic subunit (LigB family)
MIEVTERNNRVKGTEHLLLVYHSDLCTSVLYKLAYRVNGNPAIGEDIERGYREDIN